ncbi:DctP family TRAP transporter solute-binding subunit [Salinicola corii]|uniref:DctP family TRAP transporter solute-binding subunit n=1 Tax=Salinicola corii TaxID=2606937 RepID=A0A640WGT8_9GAMM|nr:DctP family TRAP transporter solute-binding subunit [Salinicola corii]KAA0019577.1 DctP family TRAP transporter solute-binding subunit [Salinicola corii]MAM59821.1 C4-dicarboxylate ABC transporter [Salinicola sp.]
MKLSIIPTAVALCLALSSNLAQAETYRLTHNTSDATSWQKGAEKFNELLAQASDGDIGVRIFPNAVLSGGDQMKQSEMVGRGDIDFVITSAINVTPLIPEMAVFSLPYLFTDYEQVDRAIQGEPGDAVKDIARDKGIEILAWGENGFRELTNSVKPVSSPDDLRGMKIRVAGPMYIDVFDALGANPQQIQWTETFSALQQGVVDGQENPVGSIIVPQRLYEVQDYLTEWHYSYDPIFVGVSERLWNSWDADTQSLVRDAAQQAMAYQRNLAREQTSTGVDTLKQNGMEITTLDEDQLQAFRDATSDVYDQWAARVGEDLVQTFEQSVGEADSQ